MVVVFAHLSGLQSAEAELGAGLGGQAQHQLPGPVSGQSWTNTPWTPAEEQHLKTLAEAGTSWSGIAKSFPSRTEGSVKKHWYKDMHYGKSAEDSTTSLRSPISTSRSNLFPDDQGITNYREPEKDLQKDAPSQRSSLLAEGSQYALHQAKLQSMERSACDHCHIREVKCDRGEPCGPCKGAKLRCSYFRSWVPVPWEDEVPNGLESAQGLHPSRTIDDSASEALASLLSPLGTDFSKKSNNGTKGVFEYPEHIIQQQHDRPSGPDTNVPPGQTQSSSMLYSNPSKQAISLRSTYDKPYTRTQDRAKGVRGRYDEVEILAYWSCHLCGRWEHNIREDKMRKHYRSTHNYSLAPGERPYRCVQSVGIQAQGSEIGKGSRRVASEYKSRLPPSDGDYSVVPPVSAEYTGEESHHHKRVRRKMTEAEKIGNRKGRNVETCDLCSTRKCSCYHNQPDIEAVGASKAHSITKLSLTPVNGNQPPLLDPPISLENSTFRASIIDPDDAYDRGEPTLRMETQSDTASTQDFEENVYQNPNTDVCTTNIRSIVRDLQQRVDQLLCDTERSQNAASPTRKHKLARRRSLPLISRPEHFRPSHDDDNTSSNAATLWSDEYEPPESPSSGRRGLPNEKFNIGRQPSLSQCLTRPDSLSAGSDREAVPVRAKSEPLVQHPAKLTTCTRVTGIRHHGLAEGQGLNNDRELQRNRPSFQASSKKRKTRDIRENEERESNEGDDPNGKRRKLFDPDAQICKARFPCLFYAGEPGRYWRHTKRYVHISQLLRHLESHNFFACSKCFTKFEDRTSSDAHDQSPCGKSCIRKSCKRHIPRGIERLSTCECITSSEEQWRELFRLQYPLKAVPFIFDNETVEIASLWEGVQDTVNQFEFASPCIPGLGEFASVEYAGHTVELSVETSNAASADTIQTDGKLSSTLQLLCQRVQLLEQRTSQPTERESHLETVLGNVWQALVRSGSSDAQPETPVWRLVRIFAPNVLSTTINSTIPVPTNLHDIGVPLSTTDMFHPEDLMKLFNDASMSGPSKNIRADSVYQTAP